MKTHDAQNERIKRRYLAFLKEAKRFSESSLDGVAKAIHRFESYTRFRDFRQFHIQQVVAFKVHLASQRRAQTDTPLSKATLLSTLNALKAFFQWLADQPGYRSRVKYADAEYFNLSGKGNAHCNGPSRAAGADFGADPLCSRRNAERIGDRAAKPCTDRIYIADRCP
jgi:integrase/recombinase XerD